MREFFLGWRRKIGVVSLFWACVVMACWVRSFSYDDLFDAWIARQSAFHFISSNSSLTFGYAWQNDGEPNVWVLNGTTLKEALMDSNKLVDWHLFSLEETPVEYFGWDWNSCGFSFVATNYDPIHKWAVRVSDVYLVLPLTALSAYLLLSKPRPSNQKKVPEPIQNEGGGAAS